MQGRFRRLITAGLAVAALASACSGGGGDGEAVSSTNVAPIASTSEAPAATDAPPAATAPTTTSAAPTSTASPGGTSPSRTDVNDGTRVIEFEDAIGSGADLSIVASRFGVAGPRLVDAEGRPTNGADGSGCSPGPGDLPDGIWYVGLVEIFETDGMASADVDLLCRYSDENAAARFPDVDFEDEHVTNDSSVLRRLVVADLATFHPGYCFTGYPAEVGTVGPALDATTELLAMRDGSDRYNGAFLGALSVWIVVEGGEIVEVFDGFYVCAG